MKPSLTQILSVSALAVLLCVGCSDRRGRTAADDAASTTSVQTEFPYPSIPNLLTTPGDRRDYLLLHYWDDFDFADTTLVLHTPDVTEQGLVNFVSLLADAEVPENVVLGAFTAFCTSLHGHAEAQSYFVDKCDDYLFDANSPVYNEALYERLLTCLVADTLIDESHRLRLVPVLELTRRNNPGSVATDFAYCTADGRLHTLLGTPAVAGRLLLIFYDPDCEHCQEVIAEMCSDPWLADALDGGRLALLAVYSEGNETLWRESLSQFPPLWQVGNDVSEAVRGGLLYDLKAMPTIYLLDADHTVLLKDASFEVVKNYMMQ